MILSISQLIAKQVCKIILLMMNKKFSGLFLRKQKNREEPRPILEFDESSFHCKLQCKGKNTDLIRVHTQIKENGMHLDETKCKWYIKNTQDFKQISDVTSTYYQPCLDDVGSIICVQIQPFIEGKKYTGITIMEETQIIELDSLLEKKLEQFLQSKQLTLNGRIQTFYSQNSKFEKWELPLQVKIELKNQSIVFKNGQYIVQVVQISEQFPNVEFIRKNFNSILLNYNQKESMKLSLNNNFNRDLFTLIVRTCVAHSCSEINRNPQSKEDKEQIDVKDKVQNSEEVCEQKKEKDEGKQSQRQIQEENIQSINIQKSSESIQNSPKSPVVSSTESLGQNSKESKQTQAKQSNTKFVLKLDEMNRELKSLKRQHETLKKDYNIEKQGKTLAQNELQNLKKTTEAIRKERDEAVTIAKKMKQLMDDNRFYKNEIVIIKNELKQQKMKNRSMEKEMKNQQQNLSSQVQDKFLMMQRNFEEMKIEKEATDKKVEGFDAEIDRYKEQLEKLGNQNINLRKKLESLANQKGIKKLEQKIPEKSFHSSKESDERIKELQMKLKNLEMLLKYKSSQGDGGSHLQLLVNKLTETITEKEMQLNESKKINKNLLEQLKEAKQKIK